LKKIIIDEKNKGKKIFRFVKSILPGLKNNEIFKLIRKKIITVNNQRVDNDYILQKNDEVGIFLKDEHFIIKGKKKKFQSINSKINVVFENDELVIVNKEKGLLSHPDKTEYKDNLYERIRAYLYKKEEYHPDNDLFAPALCNRLDRNTSGLIIAAKKHSTLKKINELFHNRNAEKTYLAIVYGKIDKKVQVISNIDDKEKKVAVANIKKVYDFIDKDELINNNSSLSITIVKPIEFTDDYSFVEIELWTGKKHQIRAHLTAIGHPLLGDRKYFNEEAKKVSGDLGFKSYYLHSHKLIIGSYPEFIAELPVEFNEKLSLLFKYK